SILLGQLSFDESQKILADIGLTAVQISSIGLALFTGSYMISREIERQTCLLMLSRPVSRDEFLLGKFGGIVLLISLLNIILPLGLLALLGKWGWLGSMAQIILSIWLEALVVLSMVFVLGVVLRPVLAVLAGIVIYLAGSWIGDLEFFAKKSGAFFSLMVSVAQWIFPNFYRFNWKNYFYLEQGLPATEINALLLHYVPWIVLLLTLSLVA